MFLIGASVLPTGDGAGFTTKAVVWNWGSASTLQWTVPEKCYLVAAALLSGTGQIRFSLSNPAPAIPSGTVTADRLFDFAAIAPMITGIAQPLEQGWVLFGTSSAAFTLVIYLAVPVAQAPE